MQKSVVWPSLLLLVGALAVDPVDAQDRPADNVVTQAEDAFGVSLGRESIGLYDASNIRGFSPTTAGNARIDGLYFDPVWGVTSLLRQSTTIRVGLSAFGFPFPAPTGVVDYRIQRPSANDRGNLFSSINSYAGSSLEFRRTERNSDGDLAMGVGLALYDNEFANGTCHRPPQWSHSGIAVMEPLHDRRYGAT